MYLTTQVSMACVDPEAERPCLLAFCTTQRLRRNVLANLLNDVESAVISVYHDGMASEADIEQAKQAVLDYCYPDPWASWTP